MDPPEKVNRQLPPCPSRRFVLTGGPGGRKTTAGDFFRREIGKRVVVVPEVATILFQGGFPPSNEPHAWRFAQTAIYPMQRHLEDVQASLYPCRAPIATDKPLITRTMLSHMFLIVVASVGAAGSLVLGVEEVRRIFARRRVPVGSSPLEW